VTKQPRNARPGATVRLSKSRYASGLQCPRLLWWRVHEPDAPELTPGPAQQAIFDQGTRVGALARDYVPGGVLIDLPHNAFRARMEATRAALRDGARVLYEASLSADDVYVAVDILERRGDGWTLIEVKSGTGVKPPYVPDAAIQTHVARAGGLDVRRVEVMHLNRGCVHPDLADLFVRADVTGAVEALLPGVPDEIGRQRAILARPLPEVAIGRQCAEPYECPFRNRCWAGEPEHHVTTLYRLGARAFDLMRQGRRTVLDVPAVGLAPVALRQQRAVRAGALVVEAGLARAIGALKPPLAFLDFETVNPAIPVWPGCRPYDQVPVQFSCHVETPRGLRHREWLAEGPGDPRRAVAEAVIAACRGARTIVGYNSGFEKTCLDLLGRAAPDLAPELDEIGARLADLLPLVRDHVYHPDFEGSFSLKVVLPVLVPGLGYDDLAISDGEIASGLLARLLIEDEPRDLIERAAVREGLLRYCERDTLGTVRLLERLRELAAG
jgi:hypothetical protein